MILVMSNTLEFAETENLRRFTIYKEDGVFWMDSFVRFS
jgi:hypothetical protein